ncbi:NADH-quinone oxidoreductase subunit J [Desulfallas thermosapovorans]|uniref:NADH-quinone oxidoreductase subunit J n=1 Tax=Desulfallas thermosapovorans DSM 6562 TaxID=1121431 RepID=A0A5S4ZRC8_9FIRM|nr:NADH-quinone oxidoreductase subunit J [Desulfallas thermosapovorans]TYO95173.1 NADH dehydrogenase subunit J [Desulfallas thermosapovorans DSM 6562]
METSIYSVIAFYGLAITILGNATLVIFARNIVHAVLFLAVTFVSMAGLFLLLDADFIAAIQVLVYAGAVCIMVVFGVMLIQRPDMKSTNLFNNQLLAGAGLTALVVAMCAVFAGRTAWTELVTTQAVPENTIHAIGALLLSKYVIPFEVVAILLLVALIGALVIARDEGVKANADD